MWKLRKITPTILFDKTFVKATFLHKEVTKVLNSRKKVCKREFLVFRMVRSVEKEMITRSLELSPKKFRQINYLVISLKLPLRGIFLSLTKI